MAQRVKTFAEEEAQRDAECGKYASAGTALALTEDEEKKRAKKSQYALDEQGRRRFHGAFTGGFSAGYYNTVGSKEGFQPATFKSSRSQKAEARSQRVEDIMDDEDFDDLVAGGKPLSAHSDYGEGPMETSTSLFGTAAELATQRPSSLRHLVPENLLMAPKDPVGVKLLRKMGWREGHGVGAKVKRGSRKRRRPQPENGTGTKKRKVYGVQLGTDAVEVEGAAHTLENALVAPRDVSVAVPQGRVPGTHGLGFDPHKHTPDFRGELASHRTGSASTVRLSMSSALSSAPSQVSGRFGIGAFEDADDIDVFDTDKLSNYDIETGEKQDGRGSTGSAEKSAKRRRGFSAGDKCADGRPVIAGFHLSEALVPSGKWFKAPKVPADFIPHHTFAESDTKPGVDRAVRSSLSVEQRGAALGEEQLKSTKSVFEFLSPEAKARLESATGRSFSDTQKQQHLGSVAESPVLAFKSDPAKQQRFKAFLQGIPPSKHDGLTPLERQAEQTEFREAASQFRKIPEAMSSRFTTASSSSSGLAPAGAGYSPLHQPHPAPPPKAPAREEPEPTAPQDPQRSEVPWVPEKLLCKRFNVPWPYQDRPLPDPRAAQATSQADSFLRSMSEKFQLPMEFTSSTTESAESTETKDEGGEMYNPLEEEDEEELAPKPSLSVFKDIFESSDDDDDSESDDE